MKHYAILSSGCYSDYSPVYYIGEYPLTQEEFTKKGKEVGDMVIAEFENYPERPHVCREDWCCFRPGELKTEKYNPSTDKRVYAVDNNKWTKTMEDWLFSLGFEKLPESIPELNIAYSDVPHN